MDDETDDRIQDEAPDEIDGEYEGTSDFSASFSISNCDDKDVCVSLLKSNHIIHLKFSATEWLE